MAAVEKPAEHTGGVANPGKNNTCLDRVPGEEGRRDLDEGCFGRIQPEPISSRQVCLGGISFRFRSNSDVPKRSSTLLFAPPGA